jgi:RNA polymerase sigma-70 factor (ECF subfamily)
MPLRHNDKTDIEILHSFYNEGSNEWLGILLQRYTGLLLGVCMKYLKNEDDAKDAVQQIFLKVINELQKYRVEYFKSWLYMIAKNHCLMKLRSLSKNTTELKENIFLTENEKEIKESAVKKEASLTHLEEALKLLNEEQRICVTLFYIEKKAYQEIVAVTDYTMMQVKSNIQNGKRNLKIQMERMTENEY